MRWHRVREGVGGQLALFAGLLLLGLLLAGASFGWIPILYVVGGPLRRQRTRVFITKLFRCYLDILSAVGLMHVELNALDPLPGQGAMLIAANHPSLLDAIMIISRLPNATCIMKASLLRNPLLGFGARVAGYIRNDSTRSLVRHAVHDLSRGSQLVIFPEGTRTAQAPINPLKGAFATIAERAGVPIQLVLIESNSRFLGKGWPLWRRPEFPLRYSVTLVERLDPGPGRDQLVVQSDVALRRALKDNQATVGRCHSAARGDSNLMT